MFISGGHAVCQVLGTAFRLSVIMHYITLCSNETGFRATFGTRTTVSSSLF
jgi:hypothetical protein